MTYLPDVIYKDAWLTLAMYLGEQMQDEELELMDAIFDRIVLDEQERVKWLSEQDDNTITE